MLNIIVLTVIATIAFIVSVTAMVVNDAFRFGGCLCGHSIYRSWMSSVMKLFSLLYLSWLSYYFLVVKAIMVVITDVSGREYHDITSI